MSSEEQNSVDTLYVYGTCQLFESGKNCTLFFFNHETKHLTIMDIYTDNKNINFVDVKAFSTKFRKRDTVHKILEPFVLQLIDTTPDLEVMSEEDIADCWSWLPGKIGNFFEYLYEMPEATEPNGFNVEIDPDDVPNTLNDDEYMNLIDSNIIPQQLATEFILDLTPA